MPNVIFGDELRVPDSVAPARWIQTACTGGSGIVRGLVPNHYASVLRVLPPDPELDDWWGAYRALYEVVAHTGERHTSTAERAWFAVWEGHGFDTITTSIAWREPSRSVDERRAREALRGRQREEDVRRTASIRAGLRDVPTFAMPDRTYHLVEGPVSAVTRLRYPDAPGEWRNPDLFWPDDRRWFVGTDVDCWSLYVGGDEDFLAELATTVPTRSEIVAFDHLVEPEV